ncbi:MAG TPA: low temperature requirement protein A [Actinomycetes bacterium]|nr:low temperature requirement protein A [Actinomycetes bacterium]
MRARDREEEHRASSPLELLFDLCFVVAVAQAAAHLHHALAEGHVGGTVLGYLMVFFAIWWAWMNFTWFASAYDTDDVIYRLLTLLQIAGVLLLAAGVPAAFEERNFATVTAGYVLMRVAMVAQWLRVAREHPEGRRVALRYATAISVLQLGWVGLGFVPEFALQGFLLLATLELLVPWWAEHVGPPTAWHPGHVAERYGLFTLIVLGESVLAATIAVQAAVASGGLSAPLVVTAGGGLVLIFALWWSYFDRPAGEGLRLAPRWVFGWGYGHLLVFACLAAVGAGLQVVAETIGHHTELSERAAALTLAVPVALYLATMGLLHSAINRYRGDQAVIRFTTVAVLIVLVALAVPPLALPTAVDLFGLLAAGLIAVDLISPPWRSG